MFEHVQPQQSPRPQLALFSRNDDRVLLVNGGAEAEVGGESEDNEVFYSEEETMEEGPSSVDLEGVDGEAWDDMCQTVTRKNSEEVRKVAATRGKLSGARKLAQIVVIHIARKEVVEKIYESDLVMVIGEQF